MTNELSASALRVQAALEARGVHLSVVELPASTRSAADAAAAIGCRVEQIVKSIVFRGQTSGDPVLVLASGPTRIDERRVAELVGEPIAKADAAYVREKTGYAIGGVPPVGHLSVLRTIVDEHLLALDVLWAAAGTPHAVFRLTPDDLLRLVDTPIVCRVA
jgi:prolyl-tRNA editing enzyme YbaK/EbsC (Cys-tRNA(Pro) deacylase)